MKTYPTKGKHAKGVRWQTRGHVFAGGRIIHRRGVRRQQSRIARALAAATQHWLRRYEAAHWAAPDAAATGKSLGAEQFYDAAREWANSKGWGDQ